MSTQDEQHDCECGEQPGWSADCTYEVESYDIVVRRGGDVIYCGTIEAMPDDVRALIQPWQQQE